MATLVTDYTTSNAYTTAVERANNAFGNYAPQSPRFARMVETRPGDRSVRVWSDNIVGALAAYSGSGNFDAFDVSGGPVVTASPDARELSLTFYRPDLVHQPGLLERKLVELANAIARTLDTLMFTTLAAAFSTTYSDGTGSPYLIDNGSTLHTLKDGSTTQSNQINAALSESSLNTAIVRLNRWKNYADNAVLHLGQDSKALIVPSDLRSTAAKLRNSMTLPGQNGAVAGDMANPLENDFEVVDTPLLSNTTRWFLVDVARTPLFYGIITPPAVTIRDGANQTTVVECSGEWFTGISGPPDGLVGSSA